MTKFLVRFPSKVTLADMIPFWTLEKCKWPGKVEWDGHDSSYLDLIIMITYYCCNGQHLTTMHRSNCWIWRRRGKFRRIRHFCWSLYSRGIPTKRMDWSRYCYLFWVNDKVLNLLDRLPGRLQFHNLVWKFVRVLRWGKIQTGLHWTLPIGMDFLIKSHYTHQVP